MSGPRQDMHGVHLYSKIQKDEYSCDTLPIVASPCHMRGRGLNPFTVIAKDADSYSYVRYDNHDAPNQQKPISAGDLRAGC